MGLLREKLGHRLTVVGMAFCFLSFLMAGCASSKKIKKPTTAFLKKQIDQSLVFSQGFTGFALMDAQSGKYLHQYQADKYFTPASNVKILTLYTSLNTLGDSIPALRYEIRGDSLLFWGTGDPSLLNPEMGNNETVKTFLASRREQLYFCPYNFQDAPLGAGWAWDDYQYYFQPEKSALPIYGNLVTFEKESNALQYQVAPQFFAKTMTARPLWTGSRAKVSRRLEGNIFEYNDLESAPYSYRGAIPFHYSDTLLTTLLEDLIQGPVHIYPNPVMPTADTKTLYGAEVKEAYRLMMQKSDNFISEQLLLLAANQLFDTLNTQKIITYSQKNLLADLADPVVWVDGSGLSRYNLLTPRSVSQVLWKLYQLKGWEYLRSIFPAGGQTGTIKDWYGGGTKAYVFAKTGTLRGVHCLSGYLVAKSGKLLIFSFMHNNYINGSREIKEEMEKVLRNLYLAY